MKTIWLLIGVLLASAANAHTASEMDALELRLQALEGHTDHPPVQAPPDPDPDPDPPPVGGVDEIDNMAPGTWLAYGEPWDTLNVNGARDFCGRPFRDIMNLWTSGVVDDGGNFWMVTPGGHTGGCDQSTYRYNIETGQPEVIVEHLPPTEVEPNWWISVDAQGNQIQPCSSHGYYGTHINGEYIYRSGYNCFGHGQKRDKPWRLHIPTALGAADPNTGWEELPQTAVGPFFARTAMFDDGSAIMANWADLYDYDYVTGHLSSISQDYFIDASLPAIYTNGTDRLWLYAQAFADGQVLWRTLTLNGAVWQEASAVALPAGVGAGFGACIVPTASGDIPILWGDDGDLHAFKPDGTWQTLSAPGGPGPRTARRAYGKWRWSERFGVCIGADRTSAGLWIYKPDIAALGGASGGQTLFEDDFSTNKFAGNGYGDPIWASGPTIVAGALHFDIPSNSGAAAAGFYQANFTSSPFGPGDSFEVRYKWRASCSLLFTDCDPASPNFKAERRFYSRHDNAETTFAKLSIVGTGDGPGFIANSCSKLETVIQHWYDHAVAGYHNCGWFEPFSESDSQGPSYSFDWQPNGAYCPTNFGTPEVRAAWNRTADTCALLDAEVWHDVRLLIDVAGWQPARSGPPLNRVRVYLDGALVIDSLRYFNEPEFAGGGFGKLWLLPYMTGKDPSENHPAAWVEYDDIRVCISACEG